MRSCEAVWAQARWLAVALGLAFLTAACQTLAAGPTPPADFHPQALWAAIWRGDTAASRQLAWEARWEATGSIEGERYHQAELLLLGQRAGLLKEAAARLAEAPFDPDRAYLHARLLEDPVRLLHRFEELAQAHPRHAWIRLGAAGACLQNGELQAAAVHLREAPPWPDAADFRSLIEARLREAQGEARPWRGLLDAALDHGSPAALSELEQMARRAGAEAIIRVAAADRALRSQPPAASPVAPGSAEEQQALDLLLERMHAQLAYAPQIGLPELLARMDGWALHLGLPAVWGNSPMYRLPFGAGLLLRPELDAGELSALLHRHQRLVLVGWSWLQGARAVELRGVERWSLDWPGLEQAVEIVSAADARGEAGWVSGGAVFRGFFVRRDLNARTARAWERRAQRLSSWELPAGVATDPWSGVDVPDLPGALPESLDLGLRLRAQLLAEEAATAEQAEWEALLLHELGHLPDVLPIASGQNPAWWGQLQRAVGSWFQDGWVLADWEYRAQLRALAAGPRAKLLLAQTIETAQDPGQPYFRPYRRLMRELVMHARAAGWPALARWHSRSEAQLAELARSLLAEQSIQPIPGEVVSQLMLKARQKTD
ncbi:MAG: hypothetical protein CMJ94_02525 [Planctomycetes bacterium]|nr:hypothetical protein [Planctomycetota bacterium]